MKMVRDAQKNSKKQQTVKDIFSTGTSDNPTRNTIMQSLIVMTTAFHISYCMYKDDYALRLHKPVVLPDI